MTGTELKEDIFGTETQDARHYLERERDVGTTCLMVVELPGPLANHAIITKVSPHLRNPSQCSFDRASSPAGYKWGIDRHPC